MKNIQLQLNWLSQCVFKASFVASDCLLHMNGHEILCQRNTSFKQYIEKTWHDSNSTLEYVHNHMLPELVAQCMVTARLHHDVNVVARNPARLKQRGHQVHTIIISWDTQITPENCPLSDGIFPSAPIRALVSDTRNFSIVLSLMIFSSLSLRLHFHKLVLFNLWPVLSTQLQVPQNSTRPVLLRIRQLSVSLSPSLLHCNSWRQTHIVSVSLNIPWLWFLPFLNPIFCRCWDKSMASVCLGKTTCQKWMARLHVHHGVRACVHALSPSQQRLIPSRSHRDDGSLWAVEFSDHVQTLPWPSSSQYCQK